MECGGWLPGREYKALKGGGAEAATGRPSVCAKRKRSILARQRAKIPRRPPFKGFILSACRFAILKKCFQILK